MRRRTGALLVSALLAGGAAIAGGVPSASAAAPPITGNVACGFDGSSTFTPNLGYGPGINDPRISPNRDSKWKLLGNLSGCTGAQSGGRPTKPVPIVSGDVLLKATAVDHECQKVTDHGLALTLLRVRWRNAGGALLGTSKATGTVTVDGLFNGWPSDDPFSPTPTHPGYTPPGIITFHATATASALSRVFPNETLTFTGTVDQTIADNMQGPCSYIGPPARQGINGFAFHGVHGPSSLAAS